VAAQVTNPTVFGGGSQFKASVIGKASSFKFKASVISTAPQNRQRMWWDSQHGQSPDFD
jgi:hypothetical protein